MSSDVVLPPIAGAEDAPQEGSGRSSRVSLASTSAGSPAVAAAPRPSGRGVVKSREIGVQRRGGARTAIHPAVQETYHTYFGATVAAGATRKLPSQQQQQGRSRERRPTPPVAQPATPAAGSMSARCTPLSGHRMTATNPALLGAQTARSSRRGQQQLGVGGGDEEEKMSSSIASFTSIGLVATPPEWLNSPYPPPVPPKDPMVDALLAGPQQSAGQRSANEGPSHPHALDLPSSHRFNYYRPLSPPKRHTCEGGPTAHLRHYMYAHRQAAAAAKSQQQQTGSGAAGVGSAEVAPEAWSSWPFVNPRLIREEKVQPSTDENEQPKQQEEKDASTGSTPPTLPGVSRLFASVVTEHERTLVFEYLRSVHSQLYQWPPPPPAPEAFKEADDASSEASSSSSPPLPTILFKDEHLDRLLEEARSAANCITLLRRLDAELALATLNGTVGQPPASDSTTTEPAPTEAPESDATKLEEASEKAPLITSSPSPPASDEQDPTTSTLISHPSPANSPPPPTAAAPAATSRVARQLDSAEQLISAVASTRSYLLALRRGLFDWLVSSPSSGAPGRALFSAATHTVFTTPSMVDALAANAARQGMAEESLQQLLEQLDHEARENPRMACTTWSDLEQRVHSEAHARVNAVLNPAQAVAEAAATAEAAQIAAAKSAHLAESASAASSASTAPSAALLRHAAHSQAYARLLLFKFLRDGSGAALFATATDVAATVAEMDAVLDATAALTLGQNYQTAWYPLSSPPPPPAVQPTSSTASSGAPGLARAVSRPVSGAAPGLSRPLTPAEGASSGTPLASSGPASPFLSPQSASRGATRPGTPHGQDGSGLTVIAPGAAASVASSTRAYGSFLAARAIRVLRSLTFHGFVFTCFGDLVSACEVHTQKLHAERLKVWNFLTGGASVPSSSDVPTSPRVTPHPSSNASPSIGLFTAYFEEVGRRERARVEAEASRAAQLKHNTHQFGQTHLMHTTANAQQQQQHTALHGSSSTVSRASVDRYRGQKSALFKTVPGHLSQRASSTSVSAISTAIPSHVIPAAAPAPVREKDPLTFFDWGLHGPNGGDPAASLTSSRAPTPPDQAAIAQAQRNSISRYASAKTLPPTASRSALLRHEPPASNTAFSLAASSSSPSAETVALPALRVTPEHVDALFGSFAHLLSVSSSTSSNGGSSEVVSTSGSAFGVAAAPSAAFDPLLEQDDEDLLLEGEPEDAYNSMDLTLLLQAYKAERPNEADDRDRQPSYLAAHPLYKPMLDQLVEANRAVDEEEQFEDGEAGQDGSANSNIPTLQSLLAPTESPEAAAARAREVAADDAALVAVRKRVDAAERTAVLAAAEAEYANEAAAMLADDYASGSTLDSRHHSHTVSKSVSVASSPYATTPPSPVNATRVVITTPPLHPRSVHSSPPKQTRTTTPQFSSAASSFAMDTSRDLVTLEGDYAPETPRGASDEVAQEPAIIPEEPAAPLPKMLAVAWQVLRDAGKIKLHSGMPSGLAMPATGPGGPGSGFGLAPFIPNSGLVVPGGSMGSMKTLLILRELARSGRAFFDMSKLVATVCSMRAERKWQRRVQAVEKRKLIAAGVTIAQPSGLPNDQYINHVYSPLSKQRRVVSTNFTASKQPSLSHPHTPTSASSTTGGPPSAAGVQFAILEQGGMSSNTRRVQVVDEEADRAAALALAEAAPRVLTTVASEQFLASSEFPATIDAPAYPPPPVPTPVASVVRRRNARGEVVQEDPYDDGSATPPTEVDDTRGRAWCRARLLTHLSSLLLFNAGGAVNTSGSGVGASTPSAVSTASPTASESGITTDEPVSSPRARFGGTNQPPAHDVVVRMGDLEALLDALGAGPRDASFLAEKLARKERESLTRLSQTQSPAGASARQTLLSLPPLAHPLSPLLAVLTWLDQEQIEFASVPDLVRTIASGEWAREYKQVERALVQRRADEHGETVTRLGEKATREAEKIVMD